jgi:hypothetical protein
MITGMPGSCPDAGCPWPEPGSAWPWSFSTCNRSLGQRLPKPHTGTGLIGGNQQRSAAFQGCHDLGCRRGVKVMATILEVTNGAARDIRPFGEFLLGPVQEATGGTALLRCQDRHSGCSCTGHAKLPILVEPRIALRPTQAKCPESGTEPISGPQSLGLGQRAYSVHHQGQPRVRL